MESKHSISDGRKRLLIASSTIVAVAVTFSAVTAHRNEPGSDQSAAAVVVEQAPPAPKRSVPTIPEAMAAEPVTLEPEVDPSDEADTDDEAPLQVLDTTVEVEPTPTTAAAPPVTEPPAPEPEPEPEPVSEPAPAPAVPEGSVWDRLAQCESGGNWHINTGNGYYGGIQFSLNSWRGVGGTGYPHEHSREHQIEMGERLKANGGWGHWPACSRKLGLR